MNNAPETVEQAAARAHSRWRLIATGLGLVLATNIINGAMNAAQLGATPPIVCVAAINDPALAKQAIEQRVDEQGRRFSVPHR